MVGLNKIKKGLEVEVVAKLESYNSYHWKSIRWSDSRHYIYRLDAEIRYEGG